MVPVRSFLGIISPQFLYIMCECREFGFIFFQIYTTDFLSVKGNSMLKISISSICLSIFLHAFFYLEFVLSGAQVAINPE